VKLLKFLDKVRWLILIIAIAKWIGFHAWILRDRLGVDPRLAFWDSLITNLLVLSVSALVVVVLRRYMPEGGKLWFAPALSFFLSLVCVWLTREAVITVGAHDARYLAFVNNTAPLRWSFDFLIMAGLTFSSVIHYRLRDQEEAISRQAATAAMVKEAELQKLQLQLQPHFLFNCLNSINALILVRPDEARKMVQQLSEFLRITLRRADEHWISLDEEWHYLQLYLEIEKVRFGHRLDVVTDFEEGTRSWKIPTLLLQPLVENAIKFGLYGTTGKVTITIEGRVQESLLGIRVTNPFDPDTQASRGNGFGLNGLKRRLYLLFARNDLLQTEVINNIFTVTLKIPRKI